MLQTLLETAVSLVFPMECQSCGTALGPKPSIGVCAPCVAKVRPMAAPFCALCGRTVVSEGMRCGSCLKESFAFDRAFCCVRYEGAARELLHHFKFNGQKHLKHFFSNLLADFYAKHLECFSIEALAAVPMDAKKRRQREFNQSALLAKELSKKIRIPDSSRWLSRSASLSDQHLLAKDARLANVRGRFSARAGHPFRDKNVLLVDDILTTGYTASECARAIKNAGARSVTVLAAARGSLA